MFECFSKRGKELRRLVDEGEYGALVYQLGFDTFSEFSELINILKGSKDGYVRLASALDFDKTGVVKGIVMNRIHAPPDEQMEKLHYATKQGFFVEGIESRARERSERALESRLHEEGFKDPKVKDEISKLRQAELRMEGLDLVAKDISEYIRINRMREQYIERTKKGFDGSIEAIKVLAVESITEQIRESPDYLELLKKKHEELSSWHVQKKENLETKYDEDLSTALDHLKNGRIKKAYLLLTALDHPGIQYIEEGTRSVRKNQAPPLLFKELLKFVKVNDVRLAQSDFAIWRRDSNTMVLVKNGRDNFIKMGYTSPENLLDLCNSVLAAVETGIWNADATGTLPEGFSPIEKKVKLLIGDGMRYEHRE